VNGSTATALRHAMLIAGRPILFATLINASGFLALALSDLPPMRQFGIVSSSAFVLALLADFTALPGALWILSRSAKAKTQEPQH
jgi:predicted RND superfamily exporter protein